MSNEEILLANSLQIGTKVYDKFNNEWTIIRAGLLKERKFFSRYDENGVIDELMEAAAEDSTMMDTTIIIAVRQENRRQVFTYGYGDPEKDVHLKEELDVVE